MPDSWLTVREILTLVKGANRNSSAVQTIARDDVITLLEWAMAIRRQQSLLDAVLTGRVRVSVEGGEVRIRD